MSKKVVYKVLSIRDYRGGAEDKVSTYVRVDQLLYDGPSYAEMDSTVYELDDFMDIHLIYLHTASCLVILRDEMAAHGVGFEYDYSVYTRYIASIKRELQALQA